MSFSSSRPHVSLGSRGNNTYCFPCGQVLSAYCYQRAGSSCLQCSSPVSVLSAMTSACYDSPSTEMKDNFTDPIRCEVKWILCLPSNCRVALWQLISASISHPNLHFNNKGLTTTPGTSCPTLCDKRVGSLTSPANHNIEDTGDGAYGL